MKDGKQKLKETLALISDKDWLEIEAEEISLRCVKEIQYPSLKKVRSWLRWNITAPMKKKVIGAYIIGSEAKGTAKPNSDIDIAIIIEPMSRKTSLKFTEDYHSKFKNNNSYPKWNGRKIDFQFFFPEDSELKKYSKIKLE